MKRTKAPNTTGMATLLCDFKPNRCDSAVYMNRKLDVTEFVKYIKDLKKEHEHVTFFHGLVFLLGKTLYSRPKMNYYVQDRHIFTHDDVSISFVAKEKFEDDSVELLTVVPIKENDTVLNVSEFVYNKVKKIRSANHGGLDNFVDKIGHLPNIIRVPLIGILKYMDRKGCLPKSLIADNLYYSSAIVSNLGTFKTGAIYHNLTNFGTASSLITFGEIVEEGNKYYMEIGATIDERIADGFYFVKALKLLEYMFKHPEVLMEPAAKHVDIPESEKK